MRSMLFVPGDDPKKLANGSASLADALIVDLEDAVVVERKAVARQITREFLETEHSPAVFVRINALNDPSCVEDIAAVAGAAPDGIMLPKCCSPEQVRMLDKMLCVMEVREGIAAGHISILPLAIEMAEAIFTLGGYRKVSPRLCGLMWGVEDLAVDLVSSVRDDEGAFLPSIELGRSLCLYAAASARVPAVDAVYPDFRDEEGLIAEAAAAQRAGFACKCAIHPLQIDVINEAFTPAKESIEAAKKIVAAFRNTPARGAVAIDGRMHDRPHLRAAELLLSRVPDVS